MDVSETSNDFPGQGGGRSLVLVKKLLSLTSKAILLYPALCSHIHACQLVPHSDLPVEGSKRETARLEEEDGLYSF